MKDEIPYASQIMGEAYEAYWKGLRRLGDLSVSIDRSAGELLRFRWTYGRWGSDHVVNPASLKRAKFPMMMLEEMGAMDLEKWRGYELKARKND